jgi:HSP20 family protein
MSLLLPSLFNKNPFLRIPNLIQELEQIQELSSQNQGLTIFEENNSIVVEASMPGLKPEEIEISFNRGILLITGEKKEENLNKEKKFYQKSLRSYKYSVALPEQIDNKNEPEASYKDGILHIVFPKLQSGEAKRIAIRSGNNIKEEKSSKNR